MTPNAAKGFPQKCSIKQNLYWHAEEFWIRHHFEQAQEWSTEFSQALENKPYSYDYYSKLLFCIVRAQPERSNWVRLHVLRQKINFLFITVKSLKCYVLWAIIKLLDLLSQKGPGWPEWGYRWPRTFRWVCPFYPCRHRAVLTMASSCNTPNGQK